MVNIVTDYVQVNKYTRPGKRRTSTKAIVIHYTATPGATAKNERDYFNGTCIKQQRFASAHYFVDDKEARLIMPENEVAYHAHDNNRCYISALAPDANHTSLAVEMCVDKNGNITSATLQNTVDLVVQLLKKYNLTISNIYRHYDITGKNCPAPWVTNPSEFETFKNRVSAKMSGKQNGWVKENNKWFYLENGSKKTGWLKEGNVWYFLDQNGIMQTGWVQHVGKWYYLEANGVMKTGWLNDNGIWYYLNSDGSMATGWIKDNGKWYFMADDGAMRTGLITYGGKQYYLKSSGELIVNKTIEIGEDGGFNFE